MPGTLVLATPISAPALRWTPQCVFRAMELPTVFVNPLVGRREGGEGGGGGVGCGVEGTRPCDRDKGRGTPFGPEGGGRSAPTVKAPFSLQ